MRISTHQKLLTYSSRLLSFRALGCRPLVLSFALTSTCVLAAMPRTFVFVEVVCVVTLSFPLFCFIAGVEEPLATVLVSVGAIAAALFTFVLKDVLATSRTCMSVCVLASMVVVDSAGPCVCAAASAVVDAHEDATFGKRARISRSKSRMPLGERRPLNTKSVHEARSATLSTRMRAFVWQQKPIGRNGSGFSALPGHTLSHVHQARN